MDQVLVVGVGGAGCAIAQRVGKVLNCEVLAVNNSQENLLNKTAHHKLSLELGANNGSLPTRQHVITAVNNLSGVFKTLINNKKKVIITVGLGGNTGTGAAPVLARIAGTQGKKVITAATLPFSFETQRKAIAEITLGQLHKKSDEILIHNHSTNNNSGNPLQDSLEDYFAQVADQFATELSAKQLGIVNR